MKTFREFLEEAYLLEKTTSSKAEGDEYHEENPPYGDEPYHIRRKSRAGKPERWRPVRANKRNAQNKRREQIKKDLTSPNDMEKGNKKERKLNAAGLQAHHINPLEKSAKLKASMSPEQWAERVRRDSEQGIYHGHHHSNLMGTVGPKTPQERRIKTAISHKAAHDLEKETEDLYSSGISRKDLLAAGQRKKMKNERASNK